MSRAESESQVFGWGEQNLNSLVSLFFNENIITIVQTAEKAAPHNDVVYKPRESMLIASDGENSPALETVIQEEIQARPDDVKLRVRRRLWLCSLSLYNVQVRLVMLYLRTGRILCGAGALPPLALLPGVVLRPGRYQVTSPFLVM